MKKILVVDDNLTNLKLISAELANYYDVSLAKSGALALQICIKEKPDLILLDVEMPEMDGFQVIEKLKQNPQLSGIPVIFLTGNHDSSTEIRGLELGARDFITKPVEKSILLHRIALHLNFSTYQSNLEKKVSRLADSINISLSEMIESRDKNTGGHVIRTSKYVHMLGSWLIKNGIYTDELTESDLEVIVRAAPLHDIGKIAISDSILLKPARLEPEEFAIMKTHAELGAEILTNMYKRTPSLGYLRYGIMIAGSHHEFYDGNGYPYGLSGNDIPLCGRIMAVADVYDALMANRIYRKAGTAEETYNIMIKDKGTHFDPYVIDAFVAIYDELSEIATHNFDNFGEGNG